MMKLSVKCECDHASCSLSFQAEISTYDISAHVESGGSISLQWPEPPLPDGWCSQYGSVYCPDHVPAWFRDK